MNYFLPAEWSPQSAVMLTWPHQDTIWADTLSAIDNVFVNIANEISKRQLLIITCHHAAHQNHVELLLKNAKINLAQIHLFQAPSNDIWVRDHGPISVTNQSQVKLLDFIFNGWGNKYPAEYDNCITHSLYRQGCFKSAEYSTIDMVVEGGALEIDDQGTLLTTKSCLLNRNPQLSMADIENKLSDLLGIKKFLWLDHGYLAGDDTDGHIDTLARFVNAETICYVKCDDMTDPHYLPLLKMEEQLKTFTNYANQPYKLIPLPWPSACYANVDGRRLPATYANFLIINEAVLVPLYDQATDKQALEILQNCFPEREVIGIPCLDLIQWYGSLHCMTMQLPRGVLS